MKEWLWDKFITYWYFIIPYIAVIFITHVLKINAKYYTDPTDKYEKNFRIMTTVMILSFCFNIIPFIFAEFEKLYIRIIMYFVYCFICWAISCSIVSFISNAIRSGLFKRIINKFIGDNK